MEARRRRYPRAEVSIVVDFAVLHAATPTTDQGLLRVLGGGGVFVEIDQNYPLGTVVRLQFKLPGEDEDVRCHGGVCNGLDGQGVGLEFLDISPRNRDRLMDFVDSQTSDT